MDSLVVWRHDFDERLLSQPGFGRFQDFERRKGSKMVELTSVVKHCFDAVLETTIHFHQTLLTNVSDQTYSHFGQQPAILLPQLRQIASFPRIRGYSKTGSAAPITRLETIGVSYTKGAIYAKFCRRRYLDDGSQLYAQCHHCTRGALKSC